MTSSSSSSSSSSSKRSRSRSRSGSPSRFKTRVLPAAAALANVLHGRHEQQRRNERLETPAPSPGPAQAAAAASPIGSVPINERSPLLSPSLDDSEQTYLGPGPGLLEDDALEDETQKTKSFWHLILLTISIGGLQIAWSVELSNGSPYLLSLGLSKSMMALVWIAGPLTGTLVQPYIGMLSDNCRVSWGKRKPFMIGGALATACSLLFLSWTKEIVGGFLGLFGADPQSQGVKVVIIVVAVIWVYILDVAINTVQAAIRAFIVDCSPVHQQEAANSMASRFVGIGNILGYCAGYVDLPKYMGFLGDTQFKVLCSIASIALCATVLVSVLAVHERNPNLDGPAAKNRPGLIAFFLTIFTSIKRLPPQVKKVCTVQFCCWVGFFPMLFYTSSYIGEIYIEPFLEENPHMTPEELDRLYEKATRVGTFALLIFAICSLVTNVFLPFFIAPTYDNTLISTGTMEAPAALVDEESKKKTFLQHLVIPGFTLRRAWLLSNIIFALAMFCTILVRTVEAATALIGLVGITWALALWAPWAIISAEISRRDAVARARKQQMETLALNESSAAAADAIVDQEATLQGEENTDKAGVILGIHNMAIASPQILATVGSSIIFKIFQKPRGTPGDHSIAIVLALGGIFTLIAAYFIHLIKDDTGPVEILSTAEEGEGLLVRTSAENVRKSLDQPRSSMQRASLARNSSFGAGLEY